MSIVTYHFHSQAVQVKKRSTPRLIKAARQSCASVDESPIMRARMRNDAAMRAHGSFGGYRGTGTLDLTQCKELNMFYIN